MYNISTSSSKNLFNISIGELVEKVSKNEISLDLIAYENNIQRDDVWNNDKKSLFIESILDSSSEIPAIMIVNKEDKYMVVDGKQRLLALLGFMNNTFKLSKKIKEDYSNKKYDDLEDSLKDKFLNTELILHEIPYISEEHLRNTFVRLNYGEKLKPVEVWRASLGDKLPLIEKMTSHELFSLFYFTPNQLKRFSDIEVALDLLMEELNPGTDHNKKSKEMFIKKEGEVVVGDEKLNNNIINKFNYLFETLNSKPLDKIKAITRSSNKMLIYRLIEEALNYEVSEDVLYNFLEEYFSNPKNSYSKIAGSTSTSNKSSLVLRYKHLLKNFKKYIKVSQLAEDIA